MITALFLITTLIIPEQETPFSAYRWHYRIIVIDQEMEAANLQFKQLLENKGGLDDRDLLVFRKEGVKLICQNSEEENLQDAVNQFSGISLIGKDGGLKLRRESWVDVQFIFDLIDSMPMRQSEMRRKSN